MFNSHWRIRRLRPCPTWTPHQTQGSSVHAAHSVARSIPQRVCFTKHQNERDPAPRLRAINVGYGKQRCVSQFWACCATPHSSNPPLFSFSKTFFLERSVVASGLHVNGVASAHWRAIIRRTNGVGVTPGWKVIQRFGLGDLIGIGFAVRQTNFARSTFGLLTVTRQHLV